LKNLLFFVVAAVALVGARTSGAAEADTASAAQSCARVLQPAERLACYDELFPPATQTESDEEKALREFGLNRTQVRERQPENMREVVRERIEAKVASVVYRSSGGRVITLDNGQVWVLTEGGSRGPLKAGDAVTIRAAALGSFMMLTPARVPLRARRID
jgi:hypothetical protein